MDLANKSLDVLFRRMDARSILSLILDGNENKREQYVREKFLEMAPAVLDGYSWDEHDNIYRFFIQNGTFGKSESIALPLALLMKYAKQFFIPGKGMPMCHREKVLLWRDASLRLGQDIFTTAWLEESGHKPLGFAWPLSVPVEDGLLLGILKDLAENHMHLFAGGSTFSITWSCVMNHPTVITQAPDSIGRSLQMYISSRPAEAAWPMARHVICAAFIRSLLFERVQDIIEDMTKPLYDFFAHYTTDALMVTAVTRQVESLGLLYGVSFEQPDTFKAVCLDYAFCRELNGEKESDLRLLAGERRLLYECFRRCRGCPADPEFGFSEQEQWIFYLYLLLKTQFRGEYIQINRQVGFKNFHDYDSRKYLMWKNMAPYWNEDYRQALNANLNEQSIASLEGRISPGKTAIESIKGIYSVDRAKLYYDGGGGIFEWQLRQWKPSFYMRNLAEKEPFYYVFHFPKRKDIPLPEKDVMVGCRHDAYRREIRETAIQLANALSNCDYFCERVRGIDACSNELYCRPEVFAMTFRFLRAFPVAFYRRTPYSRAIPALAATYHVGEDFLDISSGLRAIDEAIFFLDMRCGDRLGHALVLGVDPAVHYKKKHNQIVLSQQELLDDLVWLLYRSAELGVEIPALLKQRLEARGRQLFLQLYEPYIQEKSSTLEDYYHSMLLRGDCPACYSDRVFKVPMAVDPYDGFAVNYNGYDEHDLHLYRTFCKVTDLCFCYHHCLATRREGERMTKMEISSAYISLMRTMQTAMQNLVSDNGLCIECNPSSNVLIGTFDDYQSHPIWNFYTEGLGIPRRKPQLHVSINSDDPGVFDTTLTFEYVLLAQTLASITDEDGQRIHDDREIENYMRNLVRMGQEQCFRQEQCFPQARRPY